MSINVNVSGNPVNINRGQMFMSEIEGFKKKEAQRRRKARIEQVREQSKDIASNIREKNKKQTAQLVSNFEKQQSAALKKLTAKKLLNLHEQYDDCLENLGEAHRLAANEGSPSRYLQKKKRQNHIKGHERGKKALAKMYEEAEARDTKKRKSMCRKLVSRNIENVRSGMVSQLNKSKSHSKKQKRDRKKKHDKNESICENPSPSRNTADEHTENIDPKTYRIRDCSAKENIEGFSRVVAGSMPPQEQNSNEPRNAVYSSRIEPENKFYETQSFRPSERATYNYDPRPFEHSTYISNPTPPEPDTRLSELINRRMRSRTSDDTEAKCKPINNEYNPNDYRPSFGSISPETRPTITSSAEKPLDVPLLEVTDITDESLNTKSPPVKQPKPVEYYDHKNRYTQKYIPKSGLVQKSHADKGVLFPTEEDRQYLRKIEMQRELNAQRRGREALNKERVKRDHGILLNELSNIHKGEQIVNTYTRNKDGHLSEKRLTDKKARHQLDIEAAFENIYTPPAQMITLDPVKRSEPKIKTIDLPELFEDQQVNVGTWDSKPASGRSNEQTDSLRNLLERVSMQRELLKKELANMATSTKTLPEYKSVHVQADEIKPARKVKSKPLKKSSESIRSSLKTKSEDSNALKKSAESIQSSDGGKKKSRSSAASEQTSKTKTTKEITDKTDSSSTQSNIVIEPVQLVPQKPSLYKENLMNIRAVAGGPTVQQTMPNEIKILLKKDEDKQTSTNLSKSEFSSGSEVKTSDSILDRNGIQIIIKLNTNQSAPVTDVTKIDSGINTQNVPTKIASTSPETKWISNLEKKIEMKETSTSTSYFSPPEKFNVAEESSKNKRSPQSTPPNRVATYQLDSKTKQLIQKLLSMSRNSIDRLEVSSSDVCTPDLKVIQTRTNLETFLTDADETLLNELFQITGNSSDMSSKKSESARSKTSTIPSLPSPEPMIKDGYSELAEFCSQRIDKLTEMINQVRTETQRLYTYNPETTVQTSYLQLPSPNTSSSSAKKQFEVPEEGKQSSFKDILGAKPVQSNVETNTEDVLSAEKYFLTSTHPTQQTNFQIFDQASNISQESYREIQLQPPAEVPSFSENGYPSHSETSGNSNEKQSTSESVTLSSSSTLDTGKKFARKPPPTVIQCSQKFNVDITGAPAKELSTILEDTSKNVTDKIDTLVHNLQATRIDDKEESEKEKSKSSSDSCQEHVSIDAHSNLNEMQFQSLLDASQSTSSKVFMEVSRTNDNCPQRLDKDASVVEMSQQESVSGNILQLSNNSSSKSSSDSLDEALKQLGLGWAITTLRKTQQTMQLSSSSSSSRNASKKKREPVLKENMSLKDFIRHKQRHVTTVESSSTSIESIEISPAIKKLLNYIPSTSKLPDKILKELDNNSTDTSNILHISEILKGNLRETGRTSTPVNVKKSTDQLSEHNLFTMNQSDLSAINKPNSVDSILSLTIPDYLTDLSKSVQRSASS